MGLVSNYDSWPKLHQIMPEDFPMGVPGVSYLLVAADKVGVAEENGWKITPHIQSFRVCGHSCLLLDKGIPIPSVGPRDSISPFWVDVELAEVVGLDLPTGKDEDADLKELEGNNEGLAAEA